MLFSGTSGCTHILLQVFYLSCFSKFKTGYISGFDTWSSCCWFTPCYGEEVSLWMWVPSPDLTGTAWYTGGAVGVKNLPPLLAEQSCLRYLPFFFNI